MTDKRDHYKVIGVSPLASKEEIKKAYKVRAKKYHPDLHPEFHDQAEEKMKEIINAYYILMNTASRAKYNRSRFFAMRTPPQLRKGRKKNQFNKEMSVISRHKFNIIDKIKNFFTSAGKNEEKKGFSKDIADHFAMGITYAANSNENMLKLAKEEFEKVLSAHPENIYALFNLAMIYYRLGDFDRALESFKGVLSRNPNDSRARYMTVLLRDD